MEALGAKQAAERGALPTHFIQNLEDRLGQVEALGERRIPVIDLSGEGEEVLKDVAEACREWGFFQVVNHGVPVSTISGIFNLAKEVFDLSPGEKEAFNTLGEKLQSAGDGDPAGAYTYGAGFTKVEGKATDLRDYLRIDYSLVKQLDTWPDTPSDFGHIVKDYNEHILKLVAKILELIFEGLGVNPEKRLESFLTKKQIFMMNYYPPFHSPEMVKGSAAHSDPRAITVLLQDSLGGLEVCNQGKWYPVTPVEGAFVINLADELQILSNGMYKSAEHRVRTHSEKPRISFPVFFGPAVDAQIGPLSELVTDERPAVYRSCTNIEYIRNFFKSGLISKSALDYVRIIS